MSQDLSRCVVDASVGVKLFVQEPFSDQVMALFSRLSDDPPAELYIPDLFYIECANILLKYTRRYGRPLADAQADLADLHLLSLISTSTADLMEEALELAAERKLTAYDACYAVLARQLNLPLVTADKGLIDAIEWAVWIGKM